MVDNKFLPKLSQNLLDILNDEEYYDITIEVGNDPHVKIFRAHMVILHYRSPYLRRILSANKKKNDGSLVHIKLPNISPEAFQIILRYIYGGRLSLEELDTSNIIKILLTANELNLQELIIYLQSFLIEKKANWIEQNFNMIYQTSFENDSLLELQKYCINLMSERPDTIFKSLNFSSIPEKILISLLQNDNLKMSGVQVWDNVLKWGIAQNPEFPLDLTSFSSEDFNALKKILQQFIPFIRFYDLTSKEFMEKVMPYEEILPKELYRDLLKTFLSLLDPDSKPSGQRFGMDGMSNNNNDKKIRNNNNSNNNDDNSKHTIFISWTGSVSTVDQLHELFDPSDVVDIRYTPPKQFAHVDLKSEIAMKKAISLDQTTKNKIQGQLRVESGKPRSSSSNNNSQSEKKEKKESSRRSRNNNNNQQNKNPNGNNNNNNNDNNNSKYTIFIAWTGSISTVDQLRELFDPSDVVEIRYTPPKQFAHVDLKSEIAMKKAISLDQTIKNETQGQLRVESGKPRSKNS